MDEGKDGLGILKTPTKRARRRQIDTENSELIQELGAHIVHQDQVIDELRKKFGIIGNVCSDASNEDTKISMTTSPSKNVINLHFS